MSNCAHQPDVGSASALAIDRLKSEASLTEAVRDGRALEVEQFAARVAGGAFYAAFKSPEHARCIDVLKSAELSNPELAAAVGQSVADVSKHLRDLRELGITGFRVIANQSINFLMPAAKAVVDRTPYAWEVKQHGKTFLVTAAEFTNTAYDSGSFKPLFE